MSRKRAEATFSAGAPTPAKRVGTPARPGGRARNQRTFERICEDVRTRITQGLLRPGDKLPAERDFAQSLGVGRYAVREALRNLEESGLVELRKGTKGGAFIRHGDPRTVTRSMGDMVDLGRISLSSLTEARTVLLTSAVRFACERATAEELQALRANVERLRRLVAGDDVAARFTCISNFFVLIGAATRNEVLAMLVDSMTEIMDKLLHEAGPDPRAGVVRSHALIADRMLARDADGAVEAMTAHLRKLQRFLLHRAAVTSGR